MACGGPRLGFRVPLLCFGVVLVALVACVNPPSSSPTAQSDPVAARAPLDSPAASTGEVSPTQTPTAIATATLRPSPIPQRIPSATTAPLDTRRVHGSPTAASPSPAGNAVPETVPATTATTASVPSPSPMRTDAAVTAPSPTATAAPTPSPTPTQTPTPSPSPTPSATATAVPTATRTATALPTPSPTPTPELPAPTATQTPEPTPSPTSTPPPLQSNVQILCIFYDGEVPQTERDEYVEIGNLGSGPQDLAGWRLVDTADGSPSYEFGSYILESGAPIRVYTDEIHPEWGGFSFGRGTATWANDTPDTAGLFDESGLLISQMSYPPGCLASP